MTAMTHPRHRVTRALAQVHGLLDEITDASLWSMGTEEAGAALLEATRAATRVAELEARLATHAAAVGVPEAVGATSVANWWAHATRMTHGEAHRKTKLAGALEDHQPVHDALKTGELLPDQATAIIKAVEDLPDHVPADLVQQAEEHLVGEAAYFDAKALANLGKGLLHVIDPEAADAHHARLLEAEERAAAMATRLTLREDPDGTLRGTFTLPSAQGQMLKKQLLALAAPKHRAAVEGELGERKPSPERLGQAFCEWIERYPADRLPDAGGVSATVVVTIPIDTLHGGLKPGTLDTGAVISPGQARRLACEAGLLPMVLGGKSEVLDLGRRRRLHTRAQRIAIAHRDQHCTTEGCDWPPGMCHVHHDPSWATGGPTDIDHARLLCPRHHARAHDPTYRMTRLPGGKVAFTRRT
ncbi:HNH endonuclease signature motif containing protein [Nocardioides sp.]|uniref:HNH endonuclease signature motif containing protein n=1 Tax=Nocardioides sp. TaxID=35761 RepID=UPI002ED8979C